MSPQSNASVSQEEKAPITYGTIGAENLHQAFKDYFRIRSDKSNLIGYLEFNPNYPIDESIYLYVKYALNFFKQKKVIFVIAKLNTLGGEIFPAMKIADLFQKFDVNEGIPLIAFIDNQAIASGVILAYACRFIAITQDAVMGGQLPDQLIRIQSTPAKVMAYLLNEYASLASFYGRDPAAAEAMVDMRLFVVERDDKLISFYDANEIRTTGEHPDKVLSTNKDWLVLKAPQLMQFGIADFEITASESFQQEGQGRYRPFSSSLLSKEPYLSSIPQATIIAYENWKVSFIMLLTHPAIVSILLIGVIVSLYIQVKTVRFNTSGAVGIICILFIILASIAIHSLSWIDMIFLLLGLALVVVDACLTKEGNTSLGFLGIAVITISLVMLLLPGFEKFSLLDFESYSFAARSWIQRVIWLLSSLIVAFIGNIIIGKIFSPKFKKIPKASLVYKEQSQHKDFLETFEDIQLPKENTEGIAHCTLRPFGRVVIYDKIYDAISEGGKTILKKSSIIVVGHEQGKLIVREK
jgi:membrane-bound ClpP family serine protease